MNEETMVYVVDDDATLRQSLAWVFEAAGIRHSMYASGEEFLADVRPDICGCLVLDLYLGGSTGIELLEQMQARGDLLMPVIIVTGTGDVPSAVRTMKLGAIDLLEKPVDPPVLLKLVREALACDKKRRDRESTQTAMADRFAGLTPREREMLGLICGGLSNKQIGYKLGISIHTVAKHREHILRKTRAENTADLVRLHLTIESAA
jgi:FixJ family two-component response regulator